MLGVAITQGGWPVEPIRAPSKPASPILGITSRLGTTARTTTGSSVGPTKVTFALSPPGLGGATTNGNNGSLARKPTVFSPVFRESYEQLNDEYAALQERHGRQPTISAIVSKGRISAAPPPMFSQRRRRRLDAAAIPVRRPQKDDASSVGVATAASSVGQADYLPPERRSLYPELESSVWAAPERPDRHAPSHQHHRPALARRLVGPGMDKVTTQTRKRALPSSEETTPRPKGWYVDQRVLSPPPGEPHELVDDDDDALQTEFSRKRWNRAMRKKEFKTITSALKETSQAHEWHLYIRHHIQKTRDDLTHRNRAAERREREEKKRAAAPTNPPTNPPTHPLLTGKDKDNSTNQELQESLKKKILRVRRKMDVVTHIKVAQSRRRSSEMHDYQKHAAVLKERGLQGDAAIAAAAEAEAEARRKKNDTEIDKTLAAQIVLIFGETIVEKNRSLLLRNSKYIYTLAEDTLSFVTRQPCKPLKRVALLSGILDSTALIYALLNLKKHVVAIQEYKIGHDPTLRVAFDDRYLQRVYDGIMVRCRPDDHLAPVRRAEVSRAHILTLVDREIDRAFTKHTLFASNVVRRALRRILRKLRNARLEGLALRKAALAAAGSIVGLVTGRVYMHIFMVECAVGVVRHRQDVAASIIQRWYLAYRECQTQGKWKAFAAMGARETRKRRSQRSALWTAEMSDRRVREELQMKLVARSYLRVGDGSKKKGGRGLGAEAVPKICAAAAHCGDRGGSGQRAHPAP
mmetsp:Transcript_5685/g.15943  ORF Transcript_5685/g.15943 Transcript_5685/m.15943 type:complete len:750 (-) Transcript_5685:267-2516(-)